MYTIRVRQYMYFELETNDAQAMNTFLNKLQDSNITDKLDQNPNTGRSKRKLETIFGYIYSFEK